MENEEKKEDWQRVHEQQTALEEDEYNKNELKKEKKEQLLWALIFTAIFDTIIGVSMLADKTNKDVAWNSAQVIFIIAVNIVAFLFFLACAEPRKEKTTQDLLHDKHINEHFAKNAYDRGDYISAYQLNRKAEKAEAELLDRLSNRERWGD